MNTVDCSCGRTIRFIPGKMSEHLKGKRHIRGASRLAKERAERLPEHPNMFKVGDMDYD